MTVPASRGDRDPGFLRTAPVGNDCLVKRGRKYISVKTNSGVYARAKRVTVKCDLKVSGLM